MSGCGRGLQEVSGKSYDVFISHAGPQKASFAVWLQRELRRHGVSAFLDETSLRLGDAADVEMEAMLRSCSIIVVVLTRDYVRSSYCMEELHWALHQPHPSVQHGRPPQQSAADSGPQWQAGLQNSAPPHGRAAPMLLPVFYHTSDVCTLQQEVQQLIADAHSRGAPPAERQRLQLASDDLGMACRIAGDRLDSHGKLDAEHVDAIVAEVLRRLDRPTFQAPTYAVDLEARLQELLPLLCPDQSGGIRVLSLHGMGGIGKTTLARELFNRLSSGSLRFSGHHFLEVGQDADLQDKQAQLIRVLAGSSLHAASSAAQLQQQLQRCTGEAGPLLLVLDDVWSATQRDALLCLDRLSEGSRVVLTGRDSSTLHPDAGSSCAARPVEALAPEQAEQLLCRHAFAADRAPPGYDAAVQRALAVCGGLPLALQVVGAGMRSRSPEAAEDDVSHMLAEADTSTGRQDAAGYSLDVLTLLKWSVDRLPSDDHRHMFLDAALLMRGQPKEHLLQAWAGILQQQSQLGRKQPPTLAHSRRRAEALWSACAGATLLSCGASKWEESYSTVQVHDCMVEMAEAVCKGCVDPACWSLSVLSASDILPQGSHAQASRLYCGPAGASGMPPWSTGQLLDGHQQCQLAVVDLVPCAQRQSTVSWLTAWLGGSDGSRVHPRLVYLRLAAAPQQWAFGGQLLVLVVSGGSACSYDLPDGVAACGALRQLSVSDPQLRSLPASIGSLVHLEALLLDGCSSLACLPDSISCLRHLQHLGLANCSKLKRLPDGVGSLCSLKTLDVSECCELQQLPGGIGGNSSMRVLDVSHCWALRQLPDGIGGLSKLRVLQASWCGQLQHLPESIGALSSLQTLDVWGCELQRHEQLPDSIGSLSSCSKLSIGCCKALQQLPDSIGSLSSLEVLKISACTVLKQLPDSLCGLFSLVTLDLRNSRALEQLPLGIGSLCSLQDLNLEDCWLLAQLPASIGRLSSLRTLNVSCCKALRQLPDTIGSLGSLEALDISFCSALERLPVSISRLLRLHTLNTSHCNALVQLPDSIGSLVSLVSLNTNVCRTRRQLPDAIYSLCSLRDLCVLDTLCMAEQPVTDSVSSLTGLRTLVIHYGALQQLPASISSLVRLEMLKIHCCGMLRQLPDSISNLTRLDTLLVTSCEAFQQLPDSLGSLASLTRLATISCKALRRLPDSMSMLSRLKILRVSSCSALQQLPNDIGNLASLTKVDISECRALRGLPDSIGSLCSLQVLKMRNCTALQRLPDSISNLVSLTDLDAKGCGAVRHITSSISRLTALTTVQ